LLAPRSGSNESPLCLVEVAADGVHRRISALGSWSGRSAVFVCSRWRLCYTRGRMMENSKTPAWLVDIQNRSWEPEILISGITLTSLFLLSNHVYNLFGMLIQEYDVNHIQMYILFGISTVILTGLKLVLIAHLILRGLWTGLVGLSYVYPHGMRRHRLTEETRALDFPSPSELVIHVERVCSLLFAFVFASFSFFLTLYLLYLPAVLLRFVINNETIYLFSNVAYFLVIVPLFIFIMDRKFKNSTLRMRLRTHLLRNIYLVFVTNIGRTKSKLVFSLYFIILMAFSISDILEFGFLNKSSEFSREGVVLLVDQDKYESERDHGRRIEKATLHTFEVEDDYVSLFVSYYKQDEYTQQKSRQHAGDVKKLYPRLARSMNALPDLYRIQIDTTMIQNVRWYKTRKIKTGQQGYFATIDIDSLCDGYHELRIDKLLWRRGRKEPKLVEYWDCIPFEKRSPRAKSEQRTS
jgi:hypothetical protein